MATTKSGGASRAIRLLAETNIWTFGWRAISYVYKNLMRPLLPVSSGDFIKYSGVIVGQRIVGDRHITNRCYYPPDLSDIGDYEEALVAALDKHVKEGDTVVVVGGGLGVTVIRAALACGEEGRVICYEGDRQSVRKVIKAAKSNEVDKRVSVNYAIVGADVGVYGSSKSDIILHPRDIPDCDVLELDCEGAEIEVLLNMSITPNIITVETHGFQGAPTYKVREALESIGYEVEDYGWAEPRLAEACEKNDIRVLVGRRRIN